MVVYDTAAESGRFHGVRFYQDSASLARSTANFLAEGPAHLADARAFAKRRKAAGSSTMVRFRRMHPAQTRRRIPRRSTRSRDLPSRPRSMAGNTILPVGRLISGMQRRRWQRG